MNIHTSKYPNKLVMMYICFIAIAQSGDCQPNPGPTQCSVNSNSNTTESEVSFPCNICKLPCLWGERAVCCDTCDWWYHVDCMGMNTAVYNVLEQHSNITWICCQCGLPNLASSLFTSGSIDIDNSFSSLDSVDVDHRPLSSPLITNIVSTNQKCKP